MTAPKIPLATHVNGRKRCWRCDRWKPLADFGNDRLRADGLDPMCRRCRAEYRLERERNGYVAVRPRDAAVRVLIERHADEYAEIFQAIRREQATS